MLVVLAVQRALMAMAASWEGGTWSANASMMEIEVRGERGMSGSLPPIRRASMYCSAARDQKTGASALRGIGIGSGLGPPSAGEGLPVGRLGLVGARGPKLTMSSVIQMTASDSEAAEREASEVTGEVDIEGVEAARTSAIWTHSEARRDSRGYVGIHQELIVCPHFPPELYGVGGSTRKRV